MGTSGSGKMKSNLKAAGPSQHWLRGMLQQDANAPTHFTLVTSVREHRVSGVSVSVLCGLEMR